MRVAVVGYATDGRASAEYYAARGDDVEIRDADPGVEVADGYARLLGPDHLAGLDAFDLVVRSSGVHPDRLLAANPGAPGLAGRITTSVNEFAANSPSRRLIGVTGTKGKGTTSTLIAELLRARGARVHLGGNIGVGMLSLLGDVGPDDYCVLELSSFQLYDFSARVPTAVALTVSPEHLNWHADLADYQRAKAQLFAHQDAADLAVYNARSDTATALAAASPARRVGFDVPPVGKEPRDRDGAHIAGDVLRYGDTEITGIDEIALPGRHNLENVCAAVAATWAEIGDDLDAVRGVLRTWSGLAQHLELVREVGGVRWYNDTYATAPDAALAAVRAFDRPKVLLIGGIDKQVPQEPFTAAIAADDSVRGVVVMDDIADQLAELLTGLGVTVVHGGASMTDIVAAAAGLAEPGDVVLLSPGAAGNGGMFVDKLDRGRQFTAAVQRL